MLLALADQAVAEPPSRRPTARRLAAAISEAIPVDAAAVEGPVGDPVDEADPIERLRGSAAGAAPAPTFRRTMALALAGGVLVVLGVRQLGSSGAPTPAAKAAPNPLIDVRPAEAVPSSIVVEDGKRYRIGEPGDHLLVDDWRCDGQPTAAVFRPATHEVFVFSTWTVDEPLAVDAITAIPGAVSMVSQRGADGCPTLAVQTDVGDAVPVDLGGIR